MSLATSYARITGFAEIWGEVRLFHVDLIKSDDPQVPEFSARVSCEIHDGIDSWDELMEQVNGTIYLSLADYRNGVGINLNDWQKEYKK